MYEELADLLLPGTAEASLYVALPPKAQVLTLWDGPVYTQVYAVDDQYGVLATGMGFNSPALTSLISQRSDPEDQGGILGVSQGLASLARIVGPAWGGYLFDRWGMTAPYLSSAVLMVAACGIATVGLPATAPGPTPAPTPTVTPLE